MSNVFDQFDVNPFDAALSAEGVTDPRVAAFARSLYQQESGSGGNTATSNAGAVGGMQILPGTFKDVADKGWNINDPEQNARAGIRYAQRMYDRAGGNLRLAAAGYYGGPGGMDAAAGGRAVSDPRNPKAPNTLQYAEDVVSRMFPAASAAELPSGGNVFDQFDAKPPSGNVFDQFSPPTKATDPQYLGLIRGTQSAPPGALGNPTQKADDWLPYIFNSFKRGAASTAGLPALAYDIAELPFYFGEKALGLPTGPKPFAGTKLFDEKVGKPLFGYRDMTVPKDAYGRESLLAEGLGNVAGMVGSTLLPSGVMAGTAMKAAVAAGRSPISAAANVAARELAASVASGEGQTMGGEFGKNLGNKQLGELAGGMTGPGLLYGVLGAVDRGAGMGMPFVKNIYGKKSRDAMASEQAAKEFMGELTHPTVSANMQQANDIGAAIPGFRENITLGKASDSPLIKTFERVFGGETETARKALNMDAQANAAIDKQMNAFFPPPIAGAAPGAGIIAAHAKNQDAYDAAVRAAENRIRLYSQNSIGRSERDAVDAGTKILDARQSLAQIAQARADKLYTDAYKAADAQNVRIKPAPFVDTARAIQQSASGEFRDIPSVTGEIISKLGNLPAGSTINLQTLHGLSKNLNIELADLRRAAANGSNSAPTRIHTLEPLNDQIKDTLRGLEGPAFGDAGKKLAEATRFYREDLAPRFKEGLGARMLADTQFGARTPPDKIIDTLVMKPNDASGMRDYVNLMSGDEAGLKALEEGVMSKFAREATNDAGVATPAKIAAFQSKYKDSLDVVPWIRDKIATQGNAVQSLTEFRQSQIDAAKDYAATTMAKLAGSGDSDTIMAQAMGSRQKMEALVNNAQSPAERTAIARSIVDRIVGSENPEKMIATHRAILEKGVSPKQLSDLETIIKARAITKRVPPPTSILGQTDSDFLKKATGVGTRSIVADLRAVMMGYGSAESLGAMRGMMLWNHLSNDARNKVRRDAIFDPKMADALAKMIRSPNPQTEANAHAYLMPYAVRSVELSERTLPDQKRDPPLTVNMNGVLPQNNHP